MSQYFMVEALINHIVKSPLDNPSTVGNSSAALGSVSTWRLSPSCETSKRPLAHHVTSPKRCCDDGYRPPKRKDRMERGVLKWIHTLCGDGSSIFGECIVVSQVLNVWKCHMFWSALYNYIFILYIYIHIYIHRFPSLSCIHASLPVKFGRIPDTHMIQMEPISFGILEYYLPSRKLT